MTRTATALLAIAALGLLPGEALAKPTINVKPKSVHAGKRVHVFGSAGGCPQGDSVTLMSRAFPNTHEFAGINAVFTPVKANGRYSVRVRIPANRTPKRYRISARCGGGNFGILRKLRVLAPLP
jgi:hypothetical protein